MHTATGITPKEPLEIAPKPKAPSHPAKVVLKLANAPHPAAPKTVLPPNPAEIAMKLTQPPNPAEVPLKVTAPPNSAETVLSLGLPQVPAQVSSMFTELADAAESASLEIASLDPAEDAPVLELGEVSKEQEAWNEAVKSIRFALHNNEFQLYCQSIKDLAADVPPFQSIFVRQVEEELNMVSPGGFFELAEEFGLMSEFDRWVVCRVLEWASARKRESTRWQPSLYCINLSRDSIGDPFFPDFIKAQVEQSGLSAEALCLELQESDVNALPVDASDLVRNLRKLGCRTMLGGFGRDKILVEILKDMHFDFVKIDGSLVFNILRSDASATKIRSIVRLAHTLGINTVAELVESAETVSMLRNIEVDYAQGVAIAPVLPLHAVDHAANLTVAIGARL